MCRCPGILVISWIRSLRSVCLQPAGVGPWRCLLPVAGASVPLRFFFSADRILFLSRIVHVSRTVGRRLCVVEGIVPLPPSHRLQLVPLTFDPVSLPPPVVDVHDRWRCVHRSTSFVRSGSLNVRFGPSVVIPEDKSAAGNLLRRPLLT